MLKKRLLELGALVGLAALLFAAARAAVCDIDHDVIRVDVGLNIVKSKDAIGDQATIDLLQKAVDRLEDMDLAEGNPLVAELQLRKDNLARRERGEPEVEFERLTREAVVTIAHAEYDRRFWWWAWIFVPLIIVGIVSAIWLYRLPDPSDSSEPDA